MLMPMDDHDGFGPSQKGTSGEVRDLAVAVVGTGFSGLAMAILLKQAGIQDFVLFEKGRDVGGTWRENTYPGAACDIPSHLYSFSFEPNPSWTRAFSPQSEILAYLRHCAKKYGILPHIRFGAEVTSAVFDEPSGIWTVRTRDGRITRARALALGNGALHIPARPDIPGLSSFGGACFHSAQWDHGYDLSGKRVAVIGTGASAIQFVPQIVPQVDRLHLFQRTPPWIMPRPDRAISSVTRWLFAHVPGLHYLYRAALYWILESRAAGFVVEPRLLRLGEGLALRHLRKSVADPALRAALTPNYRMGCKRILLSTDYYPAIQAQNVELVTTSIQAVEPRGVRTRDGVLREVDAILLGTGFATSQYLAHVAITGIGGTDLNQTWAVTPEAYLGITVSGFPNLYLLMGPNTGLGHNSMVFMIEAQARYAVQCIKALRERRLVSLDVRNEVQGAFNAVLREKLARTVWASGCKSWYQNQDGTNSTLWPGFTVGYWLRTRHPRLADYTAVAEGPR